MPSYSFPVVRSTLTLLPGDYLFRTLLLDQTVFHARWGGSDASHVL